MAKRNFISNQVFVGLPWRNVRPKYDRCISRLHDEFPIYFTIVGKDDGQDALNLFQIIKDRISSSSYAIFDATGGNANVSLEYGYAEGIGVDKALFLSDHKATKRGASSTIISDLHGQRRVQYKTEKALLGELQKLARTHPYTTRFEAALSVIYKRQTGHAKRSGRRLAIAIVRSLDSKGEARRSDVIQDVQARGWSQAAVEDMMKKLHARDVVKTTKGRVASTYIA